MTATLRVTNRTERVRVILFLSITLSSFVSRQRDTKVTNVLLVLKALCVMKQIFRFSTQSQTISLLEVYFCP